MAALYTFYHNSVIKSKRDDTIPLPKIIAGMNTTSTFGLYNSSMLEDAAYLNPVLHSQNRNQQS